MPGWSNRILVIVAETNLISGGGTETAIVTFSAATKIFSDESLNDYRLFVSTP